MHHRYLSAHLAPLGHNGSLSLAPPHVDAPVSVYTAELRLPRQFKCNFTGGFDRVDGLSYPVPKALAFYRGKAVTKNDFDFERDDSTELLESVLEQTAAPQAGVKVTTPKTGNSFFFERLFSVGAVRPELDVEFTTAKPPAEKVRKWWGFS
jgi:hypothetical protein